MGANPHAKGGKLLVDLDLPPFTDYTIDIKKPAMERHESMRQLGKMLRDIFTSNAGQHNFRLFCPDETNSNRLGNVFEVENRCFVEPILSTDDHLCHGWLEGYLLTGRHGLFATYESFAMVSASMTVQHTKWLEEGIKLPWRQPIASLNILLTSTCWRNDHNGFSHQGPGLIDTVLSVADHCLRSRNYVNLIVIDKQPKLQWLSMEEAVAHCARGLSTWKWASNDEHVEPDVVLACAGDIPTQEMVAAAWWLRHHLPELKVRVVNVVDLMKLYPPYLHPHGLDDATFIVPGDRGNERPKEV